MSVDSIQPIDKIVRDLSFTVKEPPIITRADSSRSSGFHKFLDSYNAKSDSSRLVFEKDLSMEPHDTLELDDIIGKPSTLSKLLSYLSVLFLVIVFVLLGVYSNVHSISNAAQFNCNTLQKPDDCTMVPEYIKLSSNVEIALICFLSFFGIALFTKIFLTSRRRKNAGRC